MTYVECPWSQTLPYRPRWFEIACFTHEPPCPSVFVPNPAWWSKEDIERYPFIGRRVRPQL